MPAPAVNPVRTSPGVKKASKPGGADCEPRNVQRCKEVASSPEAESVAIVVDDVRLEEDIRHVLPPLLSVPDAGANSLASQLGGRFAIARMTSLVRLCHRTWVGRE